MDTGIVQKGTACTLTLLLVTAMHWVLPDASAARQVRNTTRANVNRNVNHNRNANVNRSQNINRNVKVNRDYHVHRDIDVDVDHHYGGYHPVATAAAVTAAATVTAAVVGSVVYSLPRSCSAIVVNGLTYQNCSGTWYQPQYAGSQVTYCEFVNLPNPPRLSKTGRSEAVAPETPRGSPVTHPER